MPRDAVPNAAILGSHETMSLHSIEELKTKAQAIDKATEAFVERYLEGFYEDCEPRLYFAIENLNSLIVELRRG